MDDVGIIDDPAAAIGRPGADPEPAAGRAGRAGLRRDARHAARHRAAEGQLPPASARGARAGAGGRRAPVGRADGTPAGGERGVLHRLAERAGPGRRRSGPRRRPALRELSHRPGRPHRARGQRSAPPVTGSRQAPGDPVARHRDPVPVRGRSRRLQQRAHRGRHDPRRALPRRIGPGRPRASPGGRGAPPAARIATCTCKEPSCQ